MRATEFISEGFAGIPDYKTMPAYKLKKASKGKGSSSMPKGPAIKSPSYTTKASK